jgi:CPA2 family monovalent cation:H+ antiporter-2
VGFGPVGRIVHRLLSDRGTSVTVVDLNLDSVRRMKADGLSAMYGDVLRAGTSRRPASPRPAASS